MIVLHFQGCRLNSRLGGCVPLPWFYRGPVSSGGLWPLTLSQGTAPLTYDAATQRNNYVWKTQDSWAGTCRTFDKTLNDGGSHQAMFRFVR